VLNLGNGVVHVDFDAATDGRVRLAAGLADRFNATPIGIAACAPPALRTRRRWLAPF